MAAILSRPQCVKTILISNPITKTSMKASFVIKITFYKTYCDYKSCSFLQYPGLYHLLYILIANYFVFHDENVVLNVSMHN